MEKYQILQRIEETGIIAILRGTKETELLNIADALYDGGVRLIEVTCNTPGYLAMIGSLVRHMGSKMIVGAGTVLSPDAVQLVIDAGAEFVLAPDLNPEVVQLVHQNRKLAIPGVTTPSELMNAYRLGVDVVKLFPAGDLGPSYLKNLKGPLGNVQVIPVGGINLNNLPGFAQAGAFAFGIGSELVDKKAVAAGDYQRITELASEFIAAFQKNRLK